MRTTQQGSTGWARRSGAVASADSLRVHAHGAALTGPLDVYRGEGPRGGPLEERTVSCRCSHGRPLWNSRPARHLEKRRACREKTAGGVCCDRVFWRASLRDWAHRVKGAWFASIVAVRFGCSEPPVPVAWSLNRGSDASVSPRCSDNSSVRGVRSYSEVPASHFGKSRSSLSVG